MSVLHINSCIKNITFAKFQELGIIKNVVLNLKSHGRETPVTDTKTSSSKVKSSKYLPHSTPPSTQFVSRF